jgi:ferritin-like metal-binding protein YciE
MRLESLQDLYLEELHDLYDAERQGLKILPKMMEAASSTGLRNALRDHLGQTENQIRRLETILEGLGEAPGRRKCLAMKGLVKEAEQNLGGDAALMVRDAALIAATQKIEHYEIASYGCVRTYAEVLGHQEAARLLQETLDEEEAADRGLTEMAEWTINQRAAEAAA